MSKRAGAYKSEKRKKELQRKKQQEEKRLKRIKKNQEKDSGGDQSETAEDTQEQGDLPRDE